MKYGVFIPITNGSIPSSTAPREIPTFDHNRRICQLAERHGFEFALSLVKLRGFGGPSEYWDHALESFTLMAGLAATTDRLKLYASVATPTLHPAIVARMATTIDSIAPGRFGINIVSTWNKSEYAQMGLWPGDEFYDLRYDYSSEYVTVLRELWAKGRSDFKGKFFHLDDCVCSPRPAGEIEIISAGASERGRQFTAEHCDSNFTVVRGGVEGTSAISADLQTKARATGRQVTTYLTVTVILGATDEEAEQKRVLYNTGTDTEALGRFRESALLDTGNVASGQAAEVLARKATAIDPTAIVGSPRTVACQLNELAAVPDTTGVLLSFDDFLSGIEVFGTEVMPLLD